MMAIAAIATLAALVPAVIAQNTYKYTGVTGFFDQDDPATDPSTYDFKQHNFGLISQAYDSDATAPAGATDWERFANYVASLNQAAPDGTSYKVFVQARHSTAVHNEAQTFYSTGDWTCYWSTLDGNGTVTWADGLLTASGEADTVKLNAFWATQLSTAKQPVPQSFYVSPLTRSLDTVNMTFSSLVPSLTPTIKEGLREIIDQQTQDRRSTKTFITGRYPSWTVEAGFTEEDLLFSTTTSETTAAIDVRSQSTLDSIVSADASVFISVTGHTGTLASWRRVFGLAPFALQPGGAYVTLVKAEQLTPSSTPTPAWAAHAKCSATPDTIVNGECSCPA